MTLVANSKGVFVFSGLGDGQKEHLKGVIDGVLLKCLADCAPAGDNTDNVIERYLSALSDAVGADSRFVDLPTFYNELMSADFKKSYLSAKDYARFIFVPRELAGIVEETLKQIESGVDSWASSVRSSLRWKFTNIAYTAAEHIVVAAVSPFAFASRRLAARVDRASRREADLETTVNEIQLRMQRERVLLVDGFVTSYLKFEAGRINEFLSRMRTDYASPSPPSP